MRAMTASGTVPSTMAGRMRWCSADQKASVSPARSASISRKPVCGSTKYCTEMRPDTGVQPSCTEKNRMSSRPHQKIGIE
ncbi:hypothetical protein D3C72_2205590 [compost metagenome]